MLRYTFLLILVLPAFSNAHEEDWCRGSKQERIDAFRKFGKIIEVYISKGGEFDDLYDSLMPAKLHQQVPLVLRGYQFGGRSDGGLISYGCSKDNKSHLVSVSENCDYHLGTGELVCSDVEITINLPKK